MLTIKDKRAPYIGAFLLLFILIALVAGGLLYGKELLAQIGILRKVDGFFGGNVLSDFDFVAPGGIIIAAGYLMPWWVIGVAAVLVILILSGMTVLNPNSAYVLTFFGRYVGTLRRAGFLVTIPFTNKVYVPLRLTNFVTGHLKVNDRNGNPIEIGAVVVWRVRDAAQAIFNVDDYKEFVANQADIAIRTLAAHYPYDSEDEVSLRGNIDEIADQLQQTLQGKLGVAGIEVDEARLSHLAYAAEIAGAMLKRQQAVAIFQARRYMVENALAIIDEVVQHYDGREGITLSNDKKADLINSLLVVMTGEKESQPVLSVGG